MCLKILTTWASQELIWDETAFASYPLFLSDFPSNCDLIWPLLLLLLLLIRCPRLTCTSVCALSFDFAPLPIPPFAHMQGGGDGWVSVLKGGGERCRSLTAGLQWVMTGLIAGKSGRLSSDRDEQPLRPLLNFRSILLSAQPSLCFLLFVFDSGIQKAHPTLASPFFTATCSSFIYCCFLSRPSRGCKWSSHSNFLEIKEDF